MGVGKRVIASYIGCARGIAASEIEVSQVDGYSTVQRVAADVNYCRAREAGKDQAAVLDVCRELIHGGGF